jgi:hypothetical protein
VVVLAGLAGAAAVLHRIARRPRTQAGPGFRADDDIVRRRSSVAVIPACGILVAVWFVSTLLISSPVPSRGSEDGVLP